MKMAYRIKEEDAALRERLCAVGFNVPISINRYFLLKFLQKKEKEYGLDRPTCGNIATTETDSLPEPIGIKKDSNVMEEVSEKTIRLSYDYDKDSPKDGSIGIAVACRKDTPSTPASRDIHATPATERGVGARATHSAPSYPKVVEITPSYPKPVEERREIAYPKSEVSSGSTVFPKDVPAATAYSRAFAVASANLGHSPGTPALHTDVGTTFVSNPTVAVPPHPKSVGMIPALPKAAIVGPPNLKKDSVDLNYPKDILAPPSPPKTVDLASALAYSRDVPVVPACPKTTNIPPTSPTSIRKTVTIAPLASPIRTETAHKTRMELSKGKGLFQNVTTGTTKSKAQSEVNEKSDLAHLNYGCIRPVSYSENAVGASYYCYDPPTVTEYFCSKPTAPVKPSPAYQSGTGSTVRTDSQPAYYGLATSRKKENFATKEDVSITRPDPPPPSPIMANKDTEEKKHRSYRLQLLSLVIALLAVAVSFVVGINGLQFQQIMISMNLPRSQVYHGLNMMICLFTALVSVSVGWQVFSVYRESKRQEQDDLYDLMDKVLKLLKKQHDVSKKSEGVPSFLAINHIRDDLLTPKERKSKARLWNKLVQYITVDESRIMEEVHDIGGVDFKTWRWLQSTSTP